MGDRSAISWTDATWSPPTPRYLPIAGFTGYRIGDDGTVWSCWAYNGHQPRKLSAVWRQLKPQPDGDGYLGLSLYRDGRPYRRKVHLLVLEAFVGPRPDGMQGCHEDGKVENCRLSNLRWGTPTENQRDRIKHGTSPRGNGNGKARLTEGEVLSIREARAAGELRASLAARFGVSPSTISAAARKQNWAWV